MRSGNSDHERWDSTASHNAAPKQERNEYAEAHSRRLRNDQIKVAITLALIVAILAGSAWAIKDHVYWLVDRWREIRELWP